MTNIAIPTAARAKVRAYIKGQSGFTKFCAVRGIDSREAKNKDLIDFAERFGILGKVMEIIAAETSKPVLLPSTAAVAAAIKPITPVAKAAILKQVEVLVPLDNSEVVEVPQAEAPKAREVWDVSDVLSEVEPLLSPMVRKAIEKALAPVVEKANRPAEVIERIVTVHAEAAPVAPQGAAPYAEKTGKAIEVGKLFGMKDKSPFTQRQVSLWNAHGAAPAVDPFYVVDDVNMGLLATAMEHGTNVWLVGPAGSGKTSMPEQACAYTGRPFAKIGFTRQTEVADLVGGDGFRKGETEWQDGALIAAMRRPGTVILFDEPTIAPAGVQAVIQAVADDHRSYTIHATGEVVKAAPGVVFVIADNTNGAGDETGQYAGTNQANAALVNRFKRMIQVSYMDREEEAAALVNHTSIPKPAALHVVDFFARARKLPEMEGAVLSLRQMTGFVNTVKDGFGSALAFSVAVLNKMPGTERAAVQALATLEWNAKFEALMLGKDQQEAAKPATADASDSRAAKAFDDDVSSSLNR